MLSIRSMFFSVCLAAILCATFLAPFVQEAAAGERDSYRLFERFVEDGAIPDRGYASAGLDFEMWDVDDIEWNTFMFGALAEYSVFDNFSTGARVALTHAAPKDADSAFGLTDWDIWAKYRFAVSDSVQITPGVLLNIPIGSEKIPGNSGFDFEAFGAVRYDHELVTIIGHLGFRINGDYDIKYRPDNANADQKIGLNGDASFLFGGAVIWPVHDIASIIAEFNFETSRVEDGEEAVQFTFGPDFRYWENVPIRAAFGVGATDGAPKIEFMLMTSYLF